MNDQDRARFDGLVDEVVEALPAPIMDLLAEKPVLVEDEPDPAILEEMGIPLECAGEICGLHSGPMLTERSIEADSGDIQIIHLFRVGIIEVAGGWSATASDEGSMGGPAEVRRQIRITLLHEIGHHFGLDEDDLERLGYA